MAFFYVVDTELCMDKTVAYDFWTGLWLNRTETDLHRLGQTVKVGDIKLKVIGEKQQI